MKVYEFWNRLCIDLDYRVFSGVPIKELKTIYESMSPEFLHFIPTLTEEIALGLISGAKITGTKGVVMVAAEAFDSFNAQFKRFNCAFEIPVLFIVETEYNPLNLYCKVLADDLSVIDTLIDHMDTTNESVILVVKEGVLV